jgi:putative ABC transport system ATP-binding protein
MNPVLEAKNVCLEYSSGRGVVQVLKGIDFKLERGEKVCVVGPSGSGKSSLLMVLAGLLRPTGGQVHHRGHPWPSNSDQAAGLRRSSIGLVLQEPILIPYLTLRENVMTAALSGDVAERIQAGAERLGVADLLDERPSHLSLGERQRGSILRALINDPGVILADEPTANLDLGNGREVVKLLKENLGEASMVMVTHDSRVIDESFRTFQLENGILEEGAARAGGRGRKR